MKTLRIVADCRDNHLGPEMKGYETVEFSHSNVVPHLIAPIEQP